jgi:Lrp/AsnC family transcriptional regulator, leucine-responsive regulatory protein
VRDALDSKIVKSLMDNGRMTFAELAGLLGLSAPAAAERVRRLEERGIIKGYAALVDPEKVGCGVTAFVSVALERPEHREPFALMVTAKQEIQECHHVAGDFDFLLKMRCGTLRDLERLVGEVIKGLPGVVRTRTTIALSALKETPALPLPDEEVE